MKIKSIFLTALCAAALTASAVPAKRGVTYTMSQPDGTTVSLRLMGDENHHFYVTDDEQVVIGSDGKYCYAAVDANGEPYNTYVLAHDSANRTDQERELVSSLNPQSVSQSLATKTFSATQGAARVNNQDGNGRLQTKFPTIGDVRTLVILVNYTDVKFTTENANEYFTRMLNEEGFSDNGGKGSCRDYYLDASAGKFIGDFVVYGPVELPHEQKYYGGNNSFGNDSRPAQMIIDAVEALNDEVDFSEFNLDDDLFIDNVFVFYAGKGEADGGGEDCIWPHQSSIGFSSRYRYDGVYLSRYACSSELMGNGETDGIGTFCHEFGHVLGLPDLYCTTDPYANYTPGYYSSMDTGCYLSDGKQPPTFSAYERNALNWMGDDLVEITGPASCSLEHILTSNKAYLINTDNPDEFFLFENRQKTGWDSKLPGSGMLIWHIDYDRNAWNNNSANNDPDHQRIDIVEANGAVGSSTWVSRKYTFPGVNKVTSFTFDTTPSFRSWSGTDLGLPLTNIAESNGVITFDVAGGGDDPAASVSSVISDGNIRYTLSGRQMSVEAPGQIILTDLAGRVVASSSDVLNTSITSAGIYILSASNVSKKILVK